MRYPWDIAAAVKARGGRFELTPDRSGFYIRGTRPTDDELAWIRANRDYMLLHVQHLLPPASFRHLQRTGQLDLGRKKDERKQYNPHRSSGRAETWKVNAWEEAKRTAQANAPVHRPAEDVDPLGKRNT